MINDEEFFAWLDGELQGEEVARVAAAVAASPELTAKAAQHRRLAADMRGAFSAVIEDSGAAPRFAAAEVVDFGARAAERDRKRSWFAAPQWAAMAASLAIGVIVGSQLAGGGPDSPVAIDGGQLVAASALDHALDRRLASAASPDGSRIGLTFRDASGRICRSFTGPEGNGLACRQGGAWEVKGLFPTSEGQGGDYRMATGADARLAALIDETISGEPLDAAQEKAAMEQGWR